MTTVRAIVPSGAHPGRVGLEVSGREVAVASHPGVGHVPVEGGQDLELTIEPFGDKCRLQGAEVDAGHRDQASLGDSEATAVLIDEPGDAAQHALAQIELDPMLSHFGTVFVDPGPGLTSDDDPEPQHQPVGDVDDALVLDGATLHDRAQPVVQAGHIGAGVVHVAGPRFRKGTSGGEVAVADGAQRLAQSLLVRVEAVVGQEPVVHDRSVAWSRQPPSGCRCTDSSSRSSTTRSAPAAAQRIGPPAPIHPDDRPEPAGPPGRHP